MADQLAVFLENDQPSVRVLEPSDVAAVQTFDLIAVLGVHNTLCRLRLVQLLSLFATGS